MKLITFVVTLVVFTAIATSIADSVNCDVSQRTDGARDAPASPEARDLARLHESFKLINRSTDPMGWDAPDPVAVVRAVNHLHAMGKDRAVETLRKYARYAPVHGESGRIHGFDQQRLCVLIPLLFVPIEEDGELPSLGRDAAAKAMKWEHFFISVEGGLPFHNVDFGGRSGTPDPARGYLVEWAAKQGRLRDKPLRPTDDPIKAAEDLCERLAEKVEGDRSGELLRNHIRQQTWRAIEHSFPPEGRKQFSGWLFDDDWPGLKEATAKLKIRWDEKEQQYIAG